MSITTLLADLQTINEAITGVRTAPIKCPNALNTALLPCVLIRPSTGTVSADTRAINNQKQTFVGTCYIGAANQGAGVWEKLNSLYDMIQAFINTYSAIIADPDYRLVDGSEEVMIVSYQHSGQLENLLQFGDGLYEGFEFTIEVDYVN